ncbi:MAG: hypothetical protein ISN64_02780, partial [Rickettsia sp.]|nr:hypothetical protein [Rickettsia sp.]
TEHSYTQKFVGQDQEKQIAPKDQNFKLPKLNKNKPLSYKQILENFPNNSLTDDYDVKSVGESYQDEYDVKPADELH